MKIIPPVSQHLVLWINMISVYRLPTDEDKILRTKDCPLLDLQLAGKERDLCKMTKIPQKSPVRFLTAPLAIKHSHLCKEVVFNDGNTH